MHNIEINNKLYLLPESWKELTGVQVLAVLRILFHPKHNEHDKKLRLLKLLLDAKWKLIFTFTAEQKIQLYDLFEYCFEKPTFTEQLLPKLSAGGHELIGPKKQFRNLTVNEFIYTETAYNAYCSSKNLEKLHALIAILYRPEDTRKDPESPDFDGDMRQPFNNHLIEKRLPMVKRLMPEYQMLIFYWYQACRDQLIKDYWRCFNGGGNESSGGQKSWNTFLNAMAGGKFGDFEKTKKALVHDVFTDIQMEKEQAERMKKKRPLPAR